MLENTQEASNEADIDLYDDSFDNWNYIYMRGLELVNFLMNF